MAVLAASAVLAIVAWPSLGSSNRVGATRLAQAAVIPDYRYRDQTITFYEKRIRRDPLDQISARLLAQQYLQRYRETGDSDDIARSQAQARRSIALQPGNNTSAYVTLISDETSLHHFRAARALERAAHLEHADDPNILGQMASIEMEIGRYDEAGRRVRRAAEEYRSDPELLAVLARFEEMTGHISAARVYLNRGSEIVDSVIDNSAQGRAWFHFRAGELAFAVGENEVAKADEREALAIFPNDAQALNALARFCWATKDWTNALDAATRGANIVPLPETLGYKADAERALGDRDGAVQTEALIAAIDRIGNANHTSDRLLAVYYSEHNVHLDEALAIARREVAVRGREIVAQDTLAWAAAMDGKWDEARVASRAALRFDTEDPRLEYHAGIIALHFNDRIDGRKHLRRALQLNAFFHPRYADDARR